MYQALYRKYRPLVFEDVIGQEHVVNTVKNQIVNNKISHAYMFTGTRGTGKTTCAKILARAVNCENSVDGNPCNECETCKGILNGSLLDVFEIDAASNNGVDNIRELRDDVIFTPASAKYKVYIIDEVHMLSTAAFNALLKTLEEPPAHIIFVFATTEINKVPQTILSRCQRFDFKRITVNDICARLNYVAKAEGFSIDEKACQLIAKLADGAMRDALSILDRCVSGTDTVTLETVEHTVGICPYEEVAFALECVADSNTDGILKFYSDCRKNSKDSVSLFSELCSYLRDMIIIKLTDNSEELLPYDDDKYAEVKKLSENFEVSALVRAISVLQNGIYDISKFKDKHIMAEMTLIKLTNPQIGLDAQSINERLSRLENGTVNVASVTKQQNFNETKPSQGPVLNKTDNKPIQKSSVVADDFWNQLIDNLNNGGGRSFSVFLKNIEHSVDESIIKIRCSKNEFAYSVLNIQSNIELIKQAAKAITNIDYSVVFSDKQVVKTYENDSLNELLNNANDILYEE